MRPEAAQKRSALCKKCTALFEGEIRKQCNTCFLEYHNCRCAPRPMQASGISCYVKLAPYDVEGKPSVTRKIVRSIKERVAQRTFRFLAKELAVGVKAAVAASERSRAKVGKEPLETVITYLPRSKRGASRAGFDQARELARSLAAETGYCFLPLLSRVHDGAVQKTLTRSERVQNLRGAFCGICESNKSRRVLLVDDVVTTGAGMCECARVLRATELIAVSVAFTEKKRTK